MRECPPAYHARSSLPQPSVHRTMCAKGPFRLPRPTIAEWGEPCLWPSKILSRSCKRTVIGCHHVSRNHPNPRKLRPAFDGRIPFSEYPWVHSERNSPNCRRVCSRSRHAIQAMAITSGHRDCRIGSSPGSSGSCANGGQPRAIASASACSGVTFPYRTREISRSRAFSGCRRIISCPHEWFQTRF